MSRPRARRLAALLLAVLVPSAPQAEPAPVVELTESVDGKSLADFANLWWQWAFSMPQDQSPVRDTAGTHCNVGQTAPVWFLAGGYGSSKIERRCDIPAGQHIFFPVINMLVVYPPEVVRTCAETRAQVARNNDTYVYIRISVDGIPIPDAERFRIAPHICFDPFAAAPSDARMPRTSIAATDGYWIMLRPLPPGQHRLEFRAFYTNPDAASGDMVQNIAYDLTIAPE
jgi:hypothetical protein